MVAEDAAGIGTNKIGALAALGYDYAELLLCGLAKLPEEAFWQVQNELTQSGLRCEACNGFFPTDFRLTGPDIKKDQIREYIARALDRAGALGVERVVFGSGPAKSVPSGFPVSEGWKQVAEMLHDAGEIARQYQILIAIEPLRRQESNFINTYQEGCRLAKDVAHPNVKSLVDFYHLVEEQEPVKHLREDGALLIHVHFSSGHKRLYPPQDLPAEVCGDFFEALRDIGYDGRISVEAYTQNFEADAAAALHFLREHAVGPQVG